jgi:tRNA-dihydrouridine synthase 2
MLSKNSIFSRSAQSHYSGVFLGPKMSAASAAASGDAQHGGERHEKEKDLLYFQTTMSEEDCKVKTSAPIRDYGNGKLILAPMVRMGTLPLRLQCLEYGADIVFSEELIAHKLRKCAPRWNKAARVWEFLQRDDLTRLREAALEAERAAQEARHVGLQERETKEEDQEDQGPEEGSGSRKRRRKMKKKQRVREPEVVFATCVTDHPNVLQMGAPDAECALAAAEVISPFVDGIDLNMGCPKHFSIQGGMGAALLGENPERASDILTTLRRNLPNSITCKTRILETDTKDMKRTVEMLRRLEMTGVSAITVHARLREERPAQPAHWDCMKSVVEHANLSIPLVVNGDVYTAQDVSDVLERTGADSVMIARGAQRNASVFQSAKAKSQSQLLPVYDICRRHLQLSTALQNQFGNTKFCAVTTFGMAPREERQDRDNVKSLQGAATTEALCGHFGLAEYYTDQQRELAARESVQAPVPMTAAADCDVDDLAEPSAKKARN